MGRLVTTEDGYVMFGKKTKQRTKSIVLTVAIVHSRKGNNSLVLTKAPGGAPIWTVTGR